MSASPLVTVLLPVWNGASLPLTAEGEEPLRVTIRSLARQEAAPDAPVPGFEVLAVDDGSTDGTAASNSTSGLKKPAVLLPTISLRQTAVRIPSGTATAHEPAVTIAVP